MRTGRDFGQVVVDYAAEAARHGAVYLEGIFTSARPVARTVLVGPPSWVITPEVEDGTRREVMYGRSLCHHHPPQG